MEGGPSEGNHVTDKAVRKGIIVVEGETPKID